MRQKHPFGDKTYKLAQRQIQERLCQRIDAGKIRLGALMSPGVRNEAVNKLAEAWADKSMRHACEELRTRGDTKPLERAGVAPEIIAKLVKLYR